MYQRILVPVDGSATSEAGLSEAIKLAQLTGATLRLVHVLDLMPYAGGYDVINVYFTDLTPFLREAGQKVLQGAQDRVAAAGLKLEGKLLETFGGRVSDVILEEAKASNAELIVIGTHGRRGIGRLVMGSDAEQVLRQSPVPVLLVRGKPAGA